MFLEKTKACAWLVGLAIASFPTLGFAGPCSDDIADLSRKLSASPALGPVTTGALSGAGPGSIQAKGGAGQGEMPSKTGTSADSRQGGTAGTKELNAVVGQVATSSQDARAQQQGLPTAAEVAAQGSKTSVETTPTGKTSPQPDDRMSSAKMELEKARMLDQKDDRACADSVKHARDLMGG